MKILRVVFLLIPISFFFSFTNSDLPILKYIDKYSVIAVQEMNRTGIPASITLAQGIIESRYGQSGLAKNSNNHFGIKCNNNWSGGKYYHKDDDYVNGKLIKSCFRTYNNPNESYYDHSDFLMVNSRYRFLFNYEKTDYKNWAKGLKKAGYATAKEYATTLINTIEKYQLYKYDRVESDLLVMHKKQKVVAPKAERIGEYLAFDIAANRPTTTRSNAETLVAETPPQPTVLPDNYRAGDGLKEVVEQVKGNFYDDVYGGSSRYLDEITPQIAGRE